MPLQEINHIQHVLMSRTHWSWSSAWSYY